MDQEGILLTFAEVAVAFAGFSGVVAVFGKRDPVSWSFVDRMRFFSLLHVSLLALLLCIVPFGLFAYDIAESTVWRLLSALFVINAGVVTAYLLRRLSALSASERTEISVLVIPIVLVLLLPIFVVNAHNVLSQGSFAPFLAGVIFLLTYSGFLFARMLVAAFIAKPTH